MPDITELNRAYALYNNDHVMDVDMRAGVRVRVFHYQLNGMKLDDAMIAAVKDEMRGEPLP